MNKIFINKDALVPKWIPPKDLILYRNEQLSDLRFCYDALMDGETAENIICLGKSGTGKTMCNQHLAESVLKNQQKPVKIIYIKCDRMTGFMVLQTIAKHLACPYKARDMNPYYEFIEKTIASYNIQCLVILDEVNFILSRGGDTLIRQLSRMNEDFIGKTNGRMALSMITNDLLIKNKLSPSTLSSLGAQEIIFPPYNALQLVEILQKRAELGFLSSAYNEEVISRCAAIAASQHGDARKAIDLLRVAGEAAVREGERSVMPCHIDIAERKIDMDTLVLSFKTQPIHSQIVLYAIMQLHNNQFKDIVTGDVYKNYLILCEQMKIKSLTQRRISDLIAELDMLGFINAQTISKGRYGVTRRIGLAFSKGTQSYEKISKIFEEEIG